MNTLRTVLTLALAATAASCGSTPEPDTTPQPQGKQVAITIASVTLADDCGTGPTAPPVIEESAARSERQSSAKVAAGASMSQAYMGDRACEQSSIQLRVANTTDGASKVAIQKIELIDASGEKVADLTARTPSRWADDSYQTWDEEVATGATLQVSYALSAPYVSRGETYTVRVTVATGEGERTIERKTHLEAEASLPPGVVT